MVVLQLSCLCGYLVLSCLVYDLLSGLLVCDCFVFLFSFALMRCAVLSLFCCLVLVCLVLDYFALCCLVMSCLAVSYLVLF